MGFDGKPPSGGEDRWNPYFLNDERAKNNSRAPGCNCKVQVVTRVLQGPTTSRHAGHGTTVTPVLTHPGEVLSVDRTHTQVQVAPTHRLELGWEL